MKRALLIAIACLAAAGCRRVEKQRFDGAPVILISIDTLRADHLAMFGDRDVATPNLDRLRGDAILFTNAYAHVPLTLPSHVSILTGELPPKNGVRNNIGFRFDASRHPTIASVLRGRGYATGAAVSAYVLRGSTGLRDAFDFYDDGISVEPGVAEGQLQRRGGETARIAERWIDEHSAKPFFFFLHLFEPHTPYEPTYDADIASADRITGEFLDYLRRTGVYDRALIVLLSDHGEGLGDHGEAEHGIFLYRETLHVPLLIKLPRSQRAGETVAHPVPLTGVFGTITGNAPSLLDAAAGSSPIYAESLYPRIHLGWSALRSLIDDRRHFIDAPRAELYDVQADPHETRNVAEHDRRTVASLRQAAAQFGNLDVVPSPIAPEEAQKLAALGYLSGASNASGPLPDPKDRIGDLVAMQEAQQLAHSGAIAEAIVKLRGVVERNPNFTDAFSLLADFESQAGDDAAAVQHYRRAITLSPSLAPDLALSISASLMNLERYDEAAQNAAAVATANPGGAELTLARVALARGDARGAIAHARAAQNDATQRAAASVVLAEALVKTGDFAGAQTALNDARTAGDGRSMSGFEYVRGDLLARTDHAAEAEAAFRAAIAQFPRDRRAYAGLAILQRVRGDRAGARSTLDAYARAVGTEGARAWAAKTFRELE